MARKKAKRTMADLADRHVLYQESVQDVESEIDFVVDAFEEYRGRRSLRLREDFCGTANTACEWVRRSDDHVAFAVDLDAEVLDWGRRHNVGGLTVDQQNRIELVQRDVRDSRVTDLDVVLAMNFSYYLFLTRDKMREYFESVYDSLTDDGLFFLDGYGGSDAPKEIEEPRDCGEFTYVWEQASFNPIDAQMQCYIHFEFPDGSRLDRAFSYYWRLWTLPEIRELLHEAGFERTWIYWEGTDEDSGEGNGEFVQTETADADPGWICYIIAEK